MRKRLNVLLNMAVLLLTIHYGQSLASEDFQYWNREGMEFKFKNNIKISIVEELRFQDNASLLYHHFTEAGLTIPLKKYFDLSFLYRHIYEKKGEEWLLESRPQINGTIKIKWHRCIIKDGNRFEYRIRENADNLWCYRNKLALESPFKWTLLQLQPFAADEIFYDFSKKEINRNRVYLGFKLKILRSLKGELYYLLQSSKKQMWIDWHIMGTKLQLDF